MKFFLVVAALCIGAAVAEVSHEAQLEHEHQLAELCKETGIIANPHDPEHKTFIRCELEPIELRCDDGFIFDAEKLMCVEEPKPEPEPIDLSKVNWNEVLTCPDVEDKYFRNPYDCHRFFRCYKQGHFSRIDANECVSSMIFDEVLETCLPAEQFKSYYGHDCQALPFHLPKPDPEHHDEEPIHHEGEHEGEHHHHEEEPIHHEGEHEGEHHHHEEEPIHHEGEHEGEHHHHEEEPIHHEGEHEGEHHHHEEEPIHHEGEHEGEHHHHEEEPIHHEGEHEGEHHHHEEEPIHHEGEHHHHEEEPIHHEGEHEGEHHHHEEEPIHHEGEHEHTHEHEGEHHHHEEEPIHHEGEETVPSLSDILKQIQDLFGKKH